MPRRGVFVAEISEQDALEIYTLKAELYAFSITLSFDRLSASDISRMGRLVKRWRNVSGQIRPGSLLIRN